MCLLTKGNDTYVFCVFCEPAQFFLSECALDAFGEKKAEEALSWPKPFSFQKSDLARSVGLYEGPFSSWSRMRWGVPCPFSCSPSGTGCNYMLFRWHGVPQNAFILITRFEVSSLINTSSLHGAVLLSWRVEPCCPLLLWFLPPPPTAQIPFLQTAVAAAFLQLAGC